MKKALFTLMLLAVMGSAFAQNQGTREYVSALITFYADYTVPQDSLDKYGVIIQTRSGRMATGLIDAEKYHQFLATNLVERVQPSTRVFLRDEQLNAKPEECHKANCKKYVERAADANVDAEGQNVRRHLIPEEDIRADEAKGWYVGCVLGGSTNSVYFVKSRWHGITYGSRGLNLEARVGYQFNEWLGVRSGLNLVSKNYITDLAVDLYGTYDTMRTVRENLYLQLPLMADFSVGSEVVRLHLMLGGYAGYWLSQCRTGYVYVSGDPTPYSGTTYSFVKNYDNRFEAGLAGGVGMTFQVSPQWQLHFEGDYYYALLSNVKKPYKSFNRTWTFGMGISYHF